MIAGSPTFRQHEPLAVRTRLMMRMLGAKCVLANSAAILSNQN